MRFIVDIIGMFGKLLNIILRDRRYSFDPDGPGILKTMFTVILYGGFACLIFLLILQGVYWFALDNILGAIGCWAGTLLLLVLLFVRIVKKLKDDE